MARQMSAAMLAAVQSNNIAPALFCSILFQSGAVYLWSGYGSINWNGQTWKGIGTLGKVSVVEEGATVNARGIVLTLSGFDPALVNLALSELKPAAPTTLYLGMFSMSPVALLADPVTIWAGNTDQVAIDVGPTNAILSINCESRLIDLNSVPARRYTNDDQHLDYPQDRGMEFVNAIQEVIINFGAKPGLAVNNR